MEEDGAPRPKSVSDLRKQFDGKGKAQTPVEYHQANRASAARYNLTLRMQQVAEKKKQQGLNPFDDPKLSGLTREKVLHLVDQAMGPLDGEPGKAVQRFLDADVCVEDPAIDSLSVPQLWSFLEANKIGFAHLHRISELRLAAFQSKQIVDETPPKEQHNSTANQSLAKGQLSLLAPQLTDALSTGNEHDIDRAILCMFFEEYDPVRLAEVDQLLEKYKGEEDELFAELAWKYPEHANKIVAMTINAAYGEAPTHPLLHGKEPTVPDELQSGRRASFLVF